MLATRKDGPLYVGVTSNLQKRVFEHRSAAVPGFTARFNVHRLVWFEFHDNAESAIVREKRLKRWLRSWKKELIEAANPDWRDLFTELGPS
ncbi:MAG TPA: GIY-YIG nuclease family protein [Xanthobacteraceae bacterium]|nr:GIY-YIG nuclease family protein [Xanthobacteraceae bacterium]